MQDIYKWLPDGVIEVDIHILQKLNLLNFHTPSTNDSALTRYFHVVESEEKLTLVNDQFIVWIVPERNEEEPMTHTLIALNKDNDVHLELAFVTKGVYNSSRLVLRVLEKYLLDIQNTEEQLARLNK
jgi:hypothetical protein